MCRWSENGSVTSEITGKLPFFLVDGHGSRFKLPFLEYINDEAHKWVVCIGVPYGMSMWQVGESKEKNGQYKTHLVEKKENYDFEYKY